MQHLKHKEDFRDILTLTSSSSSSSSLDENLKYIASYRDDLLYNA